MKMEKQQQRKISLDGVVLCRRRYKNRNYTDGFVAQWAEENPTTSRRVFFLDKKSPHF